MEAERIWIIKAIFILIVGFLLLFVAAPIFFGYPLDHQQRMRLIQLILPVFIGYLSSAIKYKFSNKTNKLKLNKSNDPAIRLLIKGSVYLFAFGMLLFWIEFWYTNRPNSPLGTGITIDQLVWYITVMLVLLTGTTGHIVASLFPGEKES